MPFIICPKTTTKVKHAFRDMFDLRKAPPKRNKFWYGNFRENYYEGLGGNVRVLFSGYSGAVVTWGIGEYRKHHLKDDPRPEVYMVGSVFAFRDSTLELGDVMTASDSYSPDSVEQRIYEKSALMGIAEPGKPDPELLRRVLLSADKISIPLSQHNVYCRATPDFWAGSPGSPNGDELNMETFWQDMALSPIHPNGYDCGELETAACLAACNLWGIPAVSLLDVKDKRFSETDYRVESKEQGRKGLISILKIVKRTILDGS